MDHKRDITCAKGFISELKYFGAHNGGLESVLKDNAGLFAGYKVGNAFCGDSKFLKEEDDCSAILKPDFEEIFNAQCKGK